MQLLADIAPQSPILDLDQALRIERAAFAAKVRAIRTLLGMSQAEFASHIGLTQKSVHRIEQQVVDAKVRTVLAIERFWAEKGIAVEDLPEGGFRLTVVKPWLLTRQDDEGPAMRPAARRTKR